MQPENILLTDFRTGLISGSNVTETVRTVGDLRGIFADERQRRLLPADRVVYRVQAFLPVAEGSEGGLFWGTSFVEPGQVGDEYFMTKGHFHSVRNRAEYYITVSGQGALVLMDEDRRTRAEWMNPGSTHYIAGNTAHRAVNTGTTTLVFLACWPSDAGHDYATIAEQGFGARILCVNGKPELVAER